MENLDVKDGHRNRFAVIILPAKLKSYTMQKAPMAHKTNSQEHFKFKFYFFGLSFKSVIKINSFPASKEAFLLALMFSRKLCPVFETNLMFLRSFRLIVHLKDKKFLSYEM
jgi:hypothetical protein